MNSARLKELSNLLIQSRLMTVKGEIRLEEQGVCLMCKSICLLSKVEKVNYEDVRAITKLSNTRSNIYNRYTYIEASRFNTNTTTNTNPTNNTNHIPNTYINTTYTYTNNNINTTTATINNNTTKDVTR